MTEREQIEEMARDIFDSGVAIDGIDIAFAAVHGADMTDSHFMRIAQYLYNAGYRKPLCAIGDKLYTIIEDDSSPTGYTVEINHVTEVGERYIFFSGFVPNGDDLTNQIPISELGRNFFIDEGEFRRALEARRSDIGRSAQGV